MWSGIEPQCDSRLPSPQRGEGSCEKTEIQKKISSPLPSAGEGLGVRGIAVLLQRTLLFPHLACLFGLSSGIDRACTAPPTPSLSPLTGARGTEIFNFFTPSGAACGGCPEMGIRSNAKDNPLAFASRLLFFQKGRSFVFHRPTRVSAGTGSLAAHPWGVLDRLVSRGYCIAGPIGARCRCCHLIRQLSVSICILILELLDSRDGKPS